MKKEIHVVAAVIKNDENKIFCAQRSPIMTLPNYWEFPGGKIEENESKENALIREIKEELNCFVNIHEQIEDTLYEYNTFIIRLETFWCSLQEGKPTIREHSDSKWLTYNQLFSLNWAPADIPAVREVVNQCKKESMNN